MKLNKMFREHHHGRRGITDRVDYILARKVRMGRRVWKDGSIFASVEKADEGGWAFLGKHFVTIQAAKKEARKYCNQKAAQFSGST